MPDDRSPQHPKARPVVVLAYDGLCTFEFGCAVEVFGLPRPELEPDWYRFAVAAIEPGPLRATGGVRVEADGGLDRLVGSGTVIVPGWRGVDAPVPDALCTALRAAHGAGARIVSLCSGVFVLAAAGLLDGRDATTHWRHAAELVRRFPALRFVPNVLYVDAGSVLTAAGSAAGLDLCLHLVRRDHGTVIANGIARRLVLPAHRQGGQAQSVERPVPTLRDAGSRLAPLLDRVRSTLDEDWTVARLACEAALSPRSLPRRFRDATGTSPGDWLVTARIEHARELLESSRRPITEIATVCGFGSPATLRLHFHARLGIGPASYRHAFRAPPRSDRGGD